MKEIKTAIPIQEVTLLEDRAHIKRKGSLNLPQGSSLLIIDKVSPVINDKSIRVQINTENQVKIGDATVLRTVKTKKNDQDTSLSNTRDELDTTKDQRGECQQVKEKIQTKISLLEKIQELILQEVPFDIAMGKELSSHQQESMENLDNELISLSLQKLELEKEITELDQKIHDLHTLINSMETPASYYNAAIKVFFYNEFEASTFSISVEYLVPSACWRPQHRAEMKNDLLEFSTDGCVWQNTGEDWHDVQLNFSTQRISLGAEPPILTDDRITIRKKTKDEIVEIREEDIADSGLGTVSSSVKELTELPGIDDGGIIQNVPAKGLASIPSDGCPYRVNISTYTTELEKDLVIMPELARYAVLRSVQVNTLDKPLLAGPVDLIRNNGYCGRTTILYIAPQEKFMLGWGPDPDIRIYRTESTKEEKAGVISAWSQIHHVLEIYISNIGSTTKNMKVQERIPISEIEKVKIEFDPMATTAPFTGPDENGIVEWYLILEKRGTKHLTLKHSIKTHKNISGMPE